jgi:hypothetical protein
MEAICFSEALVTITTDYAASKPRGQNMDLNRRKQLKPHIQLDIIPLHFHGFVVIT